MFEADMGIIDRMFNSKINNSKRIAEPVFDDKKSKVGLTTKKTVNKFPLGPFKSILTILSFCFLWFSFSFYSSWIFGSKITIVLIYLSCFMCCFILLLDIRSLIKFFKEK